MQYKDLSKEELSNLKDSLTKKYDEYKAEGLKLDMSRGKPSTAQLNLSNALDDVINTSSDYK